MPNATGYEEVPGIAGDPVLFFVDGYHGGVWGHMPLGAWSDILDALDRHPEWKVSLDIEPASWDAVQTTDPISYNRIRRYLEHSGYDARIEVLAGSYAQPFAWAIGGESNIRHLTRGLELLACHFPGLVVDTYAVQEPCWTSCMPQILLSLGFRRAVLKNPTAWGGYARGVDAETVNWVGPDGSAILCVPRYACEELFECYAMESSGYHLRYHDGQTPDMSAFVDKCHQHGIRHPSGTVLQDLGWAARPWLREKAVRFVTWREYCTSIAAAPRLDWHLTQDDILCTLPWGEGSLQRLAKQVRSAENRVLVTEKMVSLAVAMAGLRYPAGDLVEAWDRLLFAQHHDVWICAKVGAGRANWAWRAAAQTWAAESICDRLCAGALGALARALGETTSLGECGRNTPDPRQGGKWLLVANTLAHDRTDVVEAQVVLPPGSASLSVTTADGSRIPCQVIPTRKYAGDSSINAATVLFRAGVPAAGYNTYALETRRNQCAGPDDAARMVRDAGSALVISSDIYDIRLDTGRGGVITSLYHKALQKEFCSSHDARALGELYGYFIAQRRWASSMESPVEVRVLENGPIRARVETTGRIAGNRLRSVLTVASGQRRIDFAATVDFAEDTWVGDPHDIPPERRRLENRRSHHDDRYKLQICFPAAIDSPLLYKDAAYDVCLSQNDHTFFQRWDEIRHNIILNWVDLYDPRSGVGLAVLSDHTTSYIFGPGHPLALTFAWGWEGGFWWGKCPLRGRQIMECALVPHAGRWDEAGIPGERARWAEPLLPQMLSGRPVVVDDSLLRVLTPGVEVPTVLIQGSSVLVRLFNARAESSVCTVSLRRKPEHAELVELDGRHVAQCSVERGPTEDWRVNLPMPAFALRTLKLAGMCGNPHVQGGGA